MMTKYTPNRTIPNWILEDYVSRQALIERTSSLFFIHIMLVKDHLSERFFVGLKLRFFIIRILPLGGAKRSSKKQPVFGKELKFHYREVFYFPASPMTSGSQRAFIFAWSCGW